MSCYRSLYSGVSGELIRQDVLTGEKGAITHLDINVIDTSGCKPVTDAYVELWGANSTVCSLTHNHLSTILTKTGCIHGSSSSR